MCHEMLLQRCSIVIKHRNTERRNTERKVVGMRAGYEASGETGNIRPSLIDQIQHVQSGAITLSSFIIFAKYSYFFENILYKSFMISKQALRSDNDSFVSRGTYVGYFKIPLNFF